MSVTRLDRRNARRLRYLPGVLLVVTSLAGVACGQAGARSSVPVVPVDWPGESWWVDRHKQVLDEVKAHPETQLLLIGDSITNNYDKANPPDENFQPTWKTFYEPRQALNLGFSGDTTANVLWRLQHGEVEGLHPKVAVLLIGTNDTGFHGETAEQTEVGIDAVVAELENRLRGTRILLLAILPSEITPEKTVSDDAVNRYLATCYGEDPRVTYLDIGSIFFKGGALDRQIFYDPRLPQHGKPLHPDTTGQRMMAEAIEPTLARMMDDEPRMPLAAMAEINTALIPVPRLEDDCYDWFARHHAEIAAQRALQPRVVMIGDSITHFWAGPPDAARVSGAAAWQSLFGTLPVLNMGFGWDRTQNVLWRLREGEFEGIAPQWVVLNIGTNNLTGSGNARENTPAEVLEGIDAIVREVRQRSPKSRIVLMAIFPRGARPDDPLRAKIAATNRLLTAKYGHDADVTYLDLTARFLARDGTLPQALMPDGTHPSEAGYEIWAQALKDAGLKQ